MKRIILPTLAITAALLTSNLNAQSNRAFAVTGETKGNFTWNALREIDLSTGEVVKTYYDQASHKNFEIKAANGSKVVPTTDRMVNYSLMPMGQGVAAAAFDAKHNRLYYTSMRGTDLRYFDLNSSTGSVIYNQDATLNTGNRFDEANVITRMAFASDGVGYALTNDGKHLIRFTTDQKAAIADLGELIDGKKNGTITVHAQCSSWGGDMVGDAYGNLYLVSMRNHIFKINPVTRIADYVGQIKGLPADFTSNGMVVDAEGNAVVSSATVSDNYYRVNMSTLEATAINKKVDKVYNASDLANANLLFESSVVKPNRSVLAEVLGNNMVSVYPNPAFGRTFTVQFDKVPVGRYNLLLTDVSGRSVLTRALNIAVNGQMEKVNLPRSAASGMYLLKLTGSNKQEVYSNKIVVQ